MGIGVTDPRARIAKPTGTIQQKKVVRLSTGVLECDDVYDERNGHRAVLHQAQAGRKHAGKRFRYSGRQVDFGSFG
jgi:hypothetical protein